MTNKVLFVKAHNEDLWHMALDGLGLQVKCLTPIPGSPFVLREDDDPGHQIRICIDCLEADIMQRHGMTLREWYEKQESA